MCSGALRLLARLDVADTLNKTLQFSVFFLSSWEVHFQYLNSDRMMIVLCSYTYDIKIRMIFFFQMIYMLSYLKTTGPNLHVFQVSDFSFVSFLFMHVGVNFSAIPPIDARRDEIFPVNVEP